MSNAQQLKLSQEKLAAQLGVAFLSVNRWENNHAKPSPLALKQISRMLRAMGDRGLDNLLVKCFADEQIAL